MNAKSTKTSAHSIDSEFGKAHALQEQANKLQAEAKDLIGRAQAAKRTKLLGFVLAGGYANATDLAKDLLGIDKPDRKNRPHLTPEEKEQINTFVDAGKPAKEIAGIMNISLPYAYKFQKARAHAVAA